MKKYLFILGLVGTALFTACSTADDLVAEKPIETPSDNQDQASITTLIAEASQDSEIPITLGVGQSRGYTRKPIDPTDVGTDGYGKLTTEGGRYLGVFCLSTGYQPPYETNHPIENNWTDDTGLLVRMNNVPAVVSGGDVTFKNSSATGDQIYYYPMGNWMKYNFYAYYPWHETDVSLQITDNMVVEKNYEIDGSQDVIWGIADPNDPTLQFSGVYPYCAKYIREAKTAVSPGTDISAYLPQLKFEHKLVQFRFFVQAADAATVGAHLRITNMFINNAIYKLKLIVAHRTYPLANGDLRRGEDSDFRKKLNIKYVNPDDKTVFTDVDRFGEPYEVESPNIDVSTDTPVGYILLPAPTISGLTEKYQLCLNYSMDKVLQPEVMQVELEGTFEAGKIYNILVTVKSPEEISAKAVLQEWDDNTTPVVANILE